MFVWFGGHIGIKQPNMRETLARLVFIDVQSKPVSQTQNSI